MHELIKNLVGVRVHRWTVLEYVGRSYWKCKCDCGTVRDIFTGNLSAKKTRSCGCLRAELASIRSARHRLARSDEYKVWAGVKRRCNNSKDKTYPMYGGRGIKVCDRWSRSFEAFLDDMGKRPSPAHSIDRYPNQTGNYEPANCRWATRQQQSENKKNNRYLSLNGETRTLTEWSRRLGVTHETIRQRIGRGWSIERALTTRTK